MKFKLSKLQKSILDKMMFTKCNSALNAGAGSGKTTLLSRLAAELIKQNQRILFLNVTHRSRLELEDKLSNLKIDTNVLQNRTFHSFCYSLLKSLSGHIKHLKLTTPYSEKIHFRLSEDMKLFDEVKHIKILQELANGHDLNLNKKRASKLYQAYVTSIVQRSPLSEFYFPEDLKDLDPASKTAKKKEQQVLIQEIVHQYELLRFSSGIVTYHDIIEITALILRNDPNILRNVSINFDVITVDEFQDASRAQFEILTCLSAIGVRILVAGDNRQCINGFMGAFSSCFDDAKIVLKSCEYFSLNESQRFGPKIASLANSIAKPIKVDKSDELIGLYKDELGYDIEEVFTSRHMARKTALDIKAITDSTQLSAYNKVLVAYRKTKGNFDLIKLKKELDLHQIKYLQFPLQKKDIKLIEDVLHTLNSIKNQDLESLQEHLTSLNLKSSLKKRLAIAILKSEINDTTKFGKAQPILEKYFQLSWAQSIKTLNSPSDLIIDLFKSLVGGNEKIYDALRICICQNDDIEILCHDWKDSFQKILSHQCHDAIVLSTIHSIKGSTFDYVFLLDGSERSFSNRMHFTKQTLIDEASLLYVAATRARKKTVIYFTRGRRRSRILCKL